MHGRKSDGPQGYSENMHAQNLRNFSEQGLSDDRPQMGNQAYHDHTDTMPMPGTNTLDYGHCSRSSESLPPPRSSFNSNKGYRQDSELLGRRMEPYTDNPREAKPSRAHQGMRQSRWNKPNDDEHQITKSNIHGKDNIEASDHTRRDVRGPMKMPPMPPSQFSEPPSLKNPRHVDPSHQRNFPYRETGPHGNSSGSQDVPLLHNRPIDIHKPPFNESLLQSRPRHQPFGMEKEEHIPSVFGIQQIYSQEHQTGADGQVRFNRDTDSRINTTPDLQRYGRQGSPGRPVPRHQHVGIGDRERNVQDHNTDGFRDDHSQMDNTRHEPDTSFHSSREGSGRRDAPMSARGRGGFVARQGDVGDPRHDIDQRVVIPPNTQISAVTPRGFPRPSEGAHYSVDPAGHRAGFRNRRLSDHDSNRKVTELVRDTEGPLTNRERTSSFADSQWDDTVRPNQPHHYPNGPTKLTDRPFANIHRMDKTKQPREAPPLRPSTSMPLLPTPSDNTEAPKSLLDVDLGLKLGASSGPPNIQNQNRSSFDRGTQNQPGQRNHLLPDLNAAVRDAPFIPDTVQMHPNRTRGGPPDASTPPARGQMQNEFPQAQSNTRPARMPLNHRLPVPRLQVQQNNFPQVSGPGQSGPNRHPSAQQTRMAVPEEFAKSSPLIPRQMRPNSPSPQGLRPQGMRPQGMRPRGLSPQGMGPQGMRPPLVRPPMQHPPQGVTGSSSAPPTPIVPVSDPCTVIANLPPTVNMRQLQGLFATHDITPVEIHVSKTCF